MSTRLCAVSDCKNVVGKGGCLCTFHHAYYDRDSWDEPIVEHKVTGTERRKQGLKPKSHVPSYPIADDIGNLWLSQRLCQEYLGVSRYILSELCVTGQKYNGRQYHYIYDYKNVVFTDWYIGDDGTILKGSDDIFKTFGMKGFELAIKIMKNERVEGILFHLATDEEKVKVIKDEMSGKGEDCFSEQTDTYTGIR